MQFLKTLTQPSSMAGFAVLLGVFGVPHAPEALQSIATIATGAFGLLAIFKTE